MKSLYPYMAAAMGMSFVSGGLKETYVKPPQSDIDRERCLRLAAEKRERRNLKRQELTHAST